MKKFVGILLFGSLIAHSAQAQKLSAPNLSIRVSGLRAIYIEADSSLAELKYSDGEGALIRCIDASKESKIMVQNNSKNLTYYFGSYKKCLEAYKIIDLYGESGVRIVLDPFKEKVISVSVEGAPSAATDSSKSAAGSLE